jgi:hypothetical protein
VACLFAKKLENVGGGGSGEANALFSLTNGGKTNTSNRIEYSGVVVNCNPELCAIAAIGDMMLHRFGVRSEAFPDMLKKSDFFLTPLLRQANDPKSALTYSQDLENHKLAFGPATHQKFTHLGRGCGQRDLDDRGVELSDIQRLAKYMHDPQHQSYLVAPPARAMVAAAGGDHNDIAAHCPSWEAAKMVPALMRKAAPWLLEARMKVDAAILECKTGAEMSQKGLYSARGCLKAISFTIATSLKAAAARPLDADSRLCRDSEPRCDLYKTNELHRPGSYFTSFIPLFYTHARSILNQHHRRYRLHSIFTSDEFAQLRQRVRESEDLAHEVPTVETAGVSPITLRLSAIIEKHVRPLTLSFQKFAASCEAGNPARPPYLREQQREPELEQQQGPLLLQPQREQLREPEQQQSPLLLQPQLKKQRLSRASRAKSGQHVQSDDNLTVASMWTEYATGLNGGPSLRALENKSSKWRQYQGGRQKWHNASFVYLAIERRCHSGTAEVDAVAAVEKMLDLIPKQGKSKKPNFAELRKQLKLEAAAAAAAAAALTTLTAACA